MSDVRLFLAKLRNYIILDPHKEWPSYEPIPIEQPRLRRITHADTTNCCETRNSHLVLVTRKYSRSIIYDPFEGKVTCILNPPASGLDYYRGAFPVIRGTESSIICYSRTSCFKGSMYMTHPGKSDQKVDLAHPYGQFVLMCCSADQQGVTEDILMRRQLGTSRIYQVNLEKCRIVAFPGRNDALWHPCGADVCIQHNSIVLHDLGTNESMSRIRLIDKRSRVAWFQHALNVHYSGVKTDLFDQNRICLQDSINAMLFFDIRKLDGLVSVNEVGIPQEIKSELSITQKQIGPEEFVFWLLKRESFMTTSGKTFECMECAKPDYYSLGEYAMNWGVSVKYDGLEELEIVSDRIRFSLELGWTATNIVLIGGVLLRIPNGFLFL